LNMRVPVITVISSTEISATDRIYELGGARTLSLRRYLLGLAPATHTRERQPVACIKIPALLA
ncbi:MAG: hypothetical protein ACJATK_001108, partial [Paracoccaceae bacterium]